MSRVLRLITVAGALAGSALAAAGTDARAADAGAPKPSVLPACTMVSTESRYIPFGYRHVVILKNGCARAASCSVSTDVNPERMAAEVPAGATVEMTTFFVAASSTFTARVSCSLR